MGQAPAQYTYLVGKESTWGTGVTTDKDLGIITDINNDPRREVVESAGISDISPIAFHEGIKEGVHSVTMEFQHGRIFEFILGAATHTSSGSDQKHSWTGADNEPPSFTAQTGSNISTGDVGLQYTGCLIESAELSWELNGLLMLSFTARSKFPTKISTVPAHIVSTLPTYPHGYGTIQINGVTATKVQSGRIAFSKTLAPVDGVGSNDHLGLKVINLKIDFSLRLAFDDATFHTHFIDNDITSISVAFVNGSAFGSGKRGIEIALTSPITSGFSEVTSMGGLTFVELSGSALLSTLDTYDNITSANWF